jgi:hypothetical protein
MSYSKATTKAGRILDIEINHGPGHTSPKRPRNPRSKKTSEAQTRNNARRSKKTLQLLLAANYKPGDLYLTLTYADPEPSPENARERIGKFLRDLRRLYHKYGIPLKYIITTEGGRVHHHMMINTVEDITITKIKKLWTAGFSKIELFGGEPIDCSRMAAYITKEKKTGKTRWTCSQNLKRPKPVKVIVPASTWRETIKPPKGYYLDMDSVERGENDMGYPYLRYQLIKIEPEEEDTT